MARTYKFKPSKEKKENKKKFEHSKERKRERVQLPESMKELSW